MTDGLLSIERAAELAGVKPTTVARWIGAHGLKSEKWHGMHMIRPADLARWMASVGMSIPDAVREAADMGAVGSVEVTGKLFLADVARDEEVGTIILTCCYGYDVVGAEAGSLDVRKAITALTGRRVKVTIAPDNRTEAEEAS